MDTRNWPAEKVRRLQLLCEQHPDYTNTQIAHAMGITRNSAIGKIARLAAVDQIRKPKSGNTGGLPPSGAPKKKRQRRRVVAVHPAQHLPLVPELPEPTAPDMRPRALLELTSSSCRWPVGDPREAGFYFCGGLKVGDSGVPYCRFHMKLARSARPEAVQVT